MSERETNIKFWLNQAERLTGAGLDPAYVFDELSDFYRISQDEQLVNFITEKEQSFEDFFENMVSKIIIGILADGGGESQEV